MVLQWTAKLLGVVADFVPVHFGSCGIFIFGEKVI